MENKIIYRAEFEIRAGEIDGNKEMTIPSLMQLMQEASLKHIIQLKASVWDMADSSWVLLTKEINISRLPVLGEVVTVETYPAGVERIFAYRDYRVFDQSGKCIVSAPSTWTLFNTVKRSLEKIPPHISNLPFPNHVTPLTRCKRKIVVPEGGISSDPFKVNHFHLDWNNHVNNVNYLQFILEANTHRLKISTPKSIEIYFKAEAMEGDILTVDNVDGNQENESFHTIHKVGSSRAITQARIYWSK